MFQNEGFRFNPTPRGVVVGDPAPKTRELTVFTADHHRFFRPQEAAELRHSIYVDDRPEIHHRQQDWGSARRIEGTEDEEEEEDCEEDEDIGRDGNVKAIDGAGEGSNQNNGSNTTAERSGNSDNAIVNVGSNRDNFSKYDNVMLHGNGNDNSNRSEGHHHRYLQGAEGSGSRKKLLTEDICGFSGSRDYSEYLRRIFSDPLTGDIMNDGVILPCGHSFGGRGIQHVLRMKACYTCSRPISEDAITPNLSLRAAIQAFLREEELQVHRPSRSRKGERFEQDRGVHPDSLSMDHSKGRGVQFPFSVMDRVIIQGNKRTPQRFVGRKAIVTAQCLNGWYVVKTLDNAESVKLQYRSLAKAPEDQSSSLGQVPTKVAPNWLFSSSKDASRYTN